MQQDQFNTEVYKEIAGVDTIIFKYENTKQWLQRLNHTLTPKALEDVTHFALYPEMIYFWLKDKEIFKADDNSIGRQLLKELGEITRVDGEKEKMYHGRSLQVSFKVKIGGKNNEVDNFSIVVGDYIPKTCKIEKRQVVIPAQPERIEIREEISCEID